MDTAEKPKKIRPQAYDSIQDYLKALGFEENGGQFTRGEIKISFDSLSGHTAVTIATKYGLVEEGGI